MKKFYTIIIALLLSFLLVGCDMTRIMTKTIELTDEEILEYDNLFKKSDINGNYKYVSLKINDDNYYCFYVYKNEENYIEIMTYKDEIHYSYLYYPSSKSLTISEYNYIKNQPGRNILNTEKEKIELEEYLERYKIVKEPKFNFDLTKAKCTIEHVWGSQTYEFTWIFDNDYQYDFKLYDYDLHLTNCTLKYKDDSLKYPSTSMRMELTGIYNDIIYKIDIHID